MSADAALTPEQTHALFDILTHHETYREIEGFKYPDAVTSYGYPFKSVTRIPINSRSQSSTPFTTAPNTPRSRSPMPAEDTRNKKLPAEIIINQAEDDDVPPNESTSPVLQTLLTRFVLPLPWLRDLPRDFWAMRVQGILQRLAEASLSESYDKGAMGLRKTLATGCSALIEMVGRGALGGVKEDKGAQPKAEYDHGKAEDLERAWDDAVQQLVYGDLVPRMFKHMAETDDVDAYAPFVKATVDYAIIYLATFLHHISTVSPEGQYFLQLLQNIHNLLPYKMIKQTLRIGNAATMINGMVRLMLAKLSVGGITNWIGLTSNADDGMNLLQRIISLVLSWDAAEFRKSADRVEKDRGKDKPDEEVLQTIRDFIDREGRLEQDLIRAASLDQSQSIITAILNRSGPELMGLLSETEHDQCLAYYSALLSVQDRDAITGVLCRQQPDLFTQMIRDVVNSYEPFIRMVHQGVDLRQYFEATQGFIEDFIKASRPKKVGGGEMRAPSVEDYVELLRKNRGLLYRWIHAVASSCPEVWDELEKWVAQVVVKLRPAGQSREGDEEPVSLEVKGDEQGDHGPKDMEARLNDLVQSLPDAPQASVLEALNSHADYLAQLTKLSRSRFQYILDNTADPNSASDSQVGPGVYLSRWQDLLDETSITPGLPVGPVRRGRDVRNTLEMGKTCIVGGKGEASAAAAKTFEESEPLAPDVGVVIKELGGPFLKVLQEVGGPDA